MFGTFIVNVDHTYQVSLQFIKQKTKTVDIVKPLNYIHRPNSQLTVWQQIYAAVQETSFFGNINKEKFVW